jgi:hypothetical protein
MVHGIRDGGRRADACDFTHTFRPNAGENGVSLVNEIDL